MCSGVGHTANVTLTWTASSSTFADGYNVFRSTTNGGPYPQVAHVTGRTTTTYLDTGLVKNTNYYYVLGSTAFSWTSANTSQIQIKTPNTC